MNEDIEKPVFNASTSELELRFVDVGGYAFVHCDIHSTNMRMFKGEMLFWNDSLCRLKEYGYKRVHAFSLFEKMNQKRLFLWSKVGGLKKLAENEFGVLFFREL